MATVVINNSNFESDVLKSSEPVVVDFWAEWCGPCKMIAPALEEIATELAGQVKIAKVNIDENPELAAQYGVFPRPRDSLLSHRRVRGLPRFLHPGSGARGSGPAAPAGHGCVCQRGQTLIAPIEHAI